MKAPTPELLRPPIEAYAAPGEHRTGSEAHAATSRWIYDWLARHAIDARVAPFCTP